MLSDWQVTSCWVRFEVGWLPQTHGKITTLVASRGIARLARGSLTAAHSSNGKHLDRVRYFGYTGNVSLPPIATFFGQNLIGYSFDSWRWQERTLVSHPLSISS